MEEVIIHPRVFLRHPDLTEDDVLTAWNNTLRWVERSRSAFDEIMAVGLTARGKALEMVGVYRSDGTWLIYHAMCPPTEKALREVGLR